jgi:hypothetical protein
MRSHRGLEQEGGCLSEPETRSGCPSEPGGRGGCLSGRMPVGALGQGQQTHLPTPPNTCMQPTGVSGAIFRFGASSDAFPLGSLVLTPAANARRWAADADYESDLHSHQTIRGRGDANMQLRPAFTPPPVDPGSVQRVAALIEAIRNVPRERLLHVIAEIQAHIGKDVDRQLITSIPVDEDAVEAAAALLRPEPPIMPDITRSEFLELIGRIRSAGYDLYHISYWCEIIETNLPHPNFNHLLFDRMNELSDEEVLNTLANYNNRSLPV